MPERRRCRALAPALAAPFLFACGGAEVPPVATAGMEPAVAALVENARAETAADPRDPARRGRLGMILHAHRLAAPAAAAYAEAARLDSSARAWPHLHARLLEAGDPDAALALAEEALRRDPTASPTLALRARLLEALGRADEAGAAWEALRAARPSSIEAALALGRRDLAAGNLDAAEEAMEAVTGRAPEAAAAWSFLAQIRRRSGDPEGAAEAAARARAAARSPSSGAVGDPDPLLTAVEDLRADAAGREARARRAAAAGDAETAEAIYRRLIAERPEEPALRYNLGNVLTRRGQPDEAEAAYREALALDPESSPAMANLANLLVRTGRDAEADSLYRRAAENDPTHLPALLGASSLRFQRGDLRGAERLLRQALEVAPADPGALQGLGQLLATRGRFDEAAEALGAALRRTGSAPADASRRAGLHFLLADVEAKRGNRSEALRHLGEAEGLGMEVPPAFREALRDPG